MYVADNKQNLSTEKLQEQLERQYGPAVAQDIIDRLQKEGAQPAAAQPAPSYMDVKAMSEMAERLRAQAMMDIWRLREWRKQHDNTPSHKNLIDLEGVSIKRQCEESIKLYRHTNKTYFEMFNAAMDAMTNRTSVPFIMTQYCA
jgi:hypothetical protein